MSGPCDRAAFTGGMRNRGWGPATDTRVWLSSPHPGVAGAVIGSLIALVTGQIWLVLIAPLLGAIVGEYLSNRDPKQAVRAGMGALVGMILAGAAKYALAITMIALFLVDRFWP